MTTVITPNARKIAALNDAFRCAGPNGDWVYTESLASRDPAFVAEALCKVIAFDAFAPNNDPYGEHDFGAFDVRRGSGSRRVRVEGARPFAEYGEVLLDNFLEVAAGRARPLVSAADVRPSIALIEACYLNRRRFDVPWHDAHKRLLND